ncbi:sarcosine oxidase subunit delta [Tepidamorphus sp. 3E244]|uniref:sarcosine oxidase subunit delta n=1 Tax=Tepidamorphus sp. 3E244 TaxID=3385498 RepID=UPI0038FD03DB
MFLIQCPYCGERPETEFSYGGEAHIARPENPQALSDEEWAQFLFMRENAKGAFRERWVHTHGCRRFFNVLRNTASHEIYAVYEIGAAKPDAPSQAAAAPAKSEKKPAAKRKPAAAKAAAKPAAAKKPAAKKSATSKPAAKKPATRKRATPAKKESGE